MARVFKPKKTGGSTIKAAVFIVIIIAIVFLVYWGIENLGQTNDSKQIEIAHDAIVKASVQCYALESQFPTSLDYLVEHYGVTLDREKYVYHYRAIGANMMPEIKVLVNTSRGN